jgi:uncharacterized membrane-anchored protein YjiN (DUF445 family)
VAALHAGLREVAKDHDHPLRVQGVALLADLERRLTTDDALVARVETAKAELLEAPAVAALLDDVAAALTRTLRTELVGERSELLAWLADRLDRARQALVADAGLRAELDTWAKTRLSELVERHHARIAGFIENGVRALGPEGAVRLFAVIHCTHQRLSRRQRRCARERSGSRFDSRGSPTLA